MAASSEDGEPVVIESVNEDVVIPVTIQTPPPPPGAVRVTRQLVGQSNGTQTDTYTVPAGQTLEIVEVFHSLFPSADRSREVYALWDRSDGQELFWAAYQNGRVPVSKTFSGGETVRMRSINATGKQLFSSVGWLGNLT